MNFTTGAELLALCSEHGCAISEIMLRREAEHLETDREKAGAQMARSYEIMKEAIRTALTSRTRSMGGLIGGEAHAVSAHIARGRTASGPLAARAAAYAMGVLEVNASMGLIVAAPTAGSSGVIPGAFVALQEEYGFSDAQMVAALFNTAAVGYLLMRNASVSGAEGGCQAEVGSASAMAASGVCELLGGTPEMCLSAAAIAIANVLGLVCDPIAGLVEAPCQSRNAMGVTNALACADIALSGVRTLIPFDEMAEAMRRVGRSIPFELRETALGGTAATPTACALCKKIFE